MNPALLLYLVKTGADLLREGITQAKIAHAKGQISDEQLNQIRAAAVIADAQADADFADAKRRLGQP